MVSPADTMDARGQFWNVRHVTCFDSQSASMSTVDKMCSIEQPIGKRALWNYREWPKVSSLSEYRAKPEKRARKRCRSVVSFQTAWITTCWQVIVSFLRDGTKDKLLTQALSKSSHHSHVKLCAEAKRALTQFSQVCTENKILYNAWMAHKQLCKIVYHEIQTGTQTTKITSN